MSKKSLFCIAPDHAKVETIVDQLRNFGFANQDISVLFPHDADTLAFAQDKHTKAPEGVVAGAGTGGVLGGALGWLAGIGVIAIPGVGPFIAAGPILTALTGAAVGATMGGITGGLIGFGFPEIEARRYEGRIKAGCILLSVHTESTQEIAVAERIFKDAGAEEICAMSEYASATQLTKA